MKTSFTEGLTSRSRGLSRNARIPLNLVCIACGVALFMGCRPTSTQQPAAPPANVVATIGDLAVQVEDLSDALAKRSHALGAESATKELRGKILDELIREKTLLARARAEGLDKDPDLVRRWERMVIAKYEALHKPDAEKQGAPSAVEIEEFYHKHLAEYQRPERIRVGLIHIKGSAKATDEKRAELRARAEKILALAQAPGADFTELARLHSEDRATRYTGGDGGWMERSQSPSWWPRELAEAAFHLEISGSFAPLVEAGGSYYVVKLLGRQPAGTRPLAEVRDPITRLLKEEQRRAGEDRFYAEQRAGLAIEINETVLETVPLPTTAVAKGPDLPPSLPSN